MRLQLDSSLPGLNSTTGTAATGTTGRSSAARHTENGASTDSTSLSGTSTLLAQASVDRAARIQQLTASVRDGSYSVPSSAISRALVEEAFA